MTFHRTARATSLGTFAVEGDGLIRVAQLETESPQKSYFLDGARRLDIRTLLSKVAETYAVSDDPSDYFFEAIRANTANCANENNDAFHQDELLRFDCRLGMPVYMTYAGKPHHLNHKTENAKAARGLIIDAHYNTDAPSLETCPGCQTRTADRVNRDRTGMHCKKCGTMVRDEFVEILVGIDAKKDPLFAEGVRKGNLKAGSMGCNCLSTTCNVCNHVAYARPEFCEHIRAGNKGSLWMRSGSKWVKSNSSDVAKELRKRKLAYVPNDFCYVNIDGFEARKAFEYCNHVIFDEYSRVDQPADPKALQVEILKAAQLEGLPAPDALRAETEALIRSAEKKRKEAEAVMSRAAQRTPPTHNPQHPGQLPRAPMVPPIAPLPNGPATSPEEVGLMDQHGVGIQLDPGDDPIVIEPPGGGGMPGEEQMPGGMPGQPGMPGQTNIEQYTDQEMAPPGGPAAPPGEEMDMGELGVLPVPPGASAPRRGRRSSMRKFSQAYSKWTVQVSEQGNARLLTEAREPVLVFRASKATQDPEERRTYGLEVLGFLLDHGLVKTAKQYGAYFSPRFAQVVEHATDDMKEFADKSMYSSVIENNRDDMQGNLRGTPPTAVVPGGIDVMDGDIRGKPPGDTQTDGVMDHERDDQGVESAVGEDHETMRDKRPPFSMSKNTVLENEVHDHAESLHGKRGEAPPALHIGARVAHKSNAAIGYLITAARMLESGEVEYEARGSDKKAYRIEASTLEDWVSLDKQPATLKLPGQPTQVFAAGAEKCGDCNKLMFGGADKHKCEGKSESKDEDKKEAMKRVATAEKLEKLASAKLAKAKAELEKAKAEAETQARVASEASVKSFCRAMRIVATRQGADLESAPLKLAAEAVLSEPRIIGKDAATGRPIEYRGFDPELTRYLVAELYEVGHADHLDQLMRRAAELMTKGDQYLVDAEADLKNLHYTLPAISRSRVAEFDEDALHAADMRRQASGGNLRFTPAPSEAIAPGNGHDKRGAIRSALGGTLVEAARGRLGVPS